MFWKWWLMKCSISDSNQAKFKAEGRSAIALILRSWYKGRQSDIEKSFRFSTLFSCCWPNVYKKYSISSASWSITQPDRYDNWPLHVQTKHISKSRVPGNIAYLAYFLTSILAMLEIDLATRKHHPQKRSYQSRFFSMHRLDWFEVETFVPDSTDTFVPDDDCFSTQDSLYKPCGSYGVF